MATITPKGKGMFLWNYTKTIDAIVDECLDANLDHILLKIADGAVEFSPTYDKMGLIKALQAAGIEVWGWHYVYLNLPIAEAKIAKAMMEKYPLTGYVIDGEAECKGKPNQATQFMIELKTDGTGYTTFSIGLSSYRYPRYHATFPWKQFRNYCDFDMPQVYWVDSHNPTIQLATSHAEFAKLEPKLPYVATGAAWRNLNSNGTVKWTPTPQELTDFMQKAKDLGLPGVNFWEFNKTIALPALWDAISDFVWIVPPPLPPPGPAPDHQHLDLEKEILGLKVSHNDVVEDLQALANRVNNLALLLAEHAKYDFTSFREKFKMAERKPALSMNGINGVGKPMYSIYPRENAPTSERIFLEGVIDVAPVILTGDSGRKVFPVYRSATNVQLYVDLDYGELWPTT